MGNIEYGSSQKTKIIDDNGSTVITTTNYRAGVGIVTERVNVRERLPSRQVDAISLAERLRDLFADETKINPSIEIETKSNGQHSNYYLVISYTLVGIE